MDAMMTTVTVTAVDRARAHPPTNPAYFQGSVHMQELYRPDRDGEESELLAVFFESGARTRPHTHDSNQVLQVITGRCILATETGRRTVEAGQFAVVPRGTWHWHGATADGPMCHISIKLPGRTHWDAPLRDWAGGGAEKKDRHD